MSKYSKKLAIQRLTTAISIAHQEAIRLEAISPGRGSWLIMRAESLALHLIEVKNLPIDGVKVIP